jgi:hypothetical protein
MDYTETQKRLREHTFYLLQHYKYVVDADIEAEENQELNLSFGVLAKIFQHCVSAVYLSDGVMLPAIANNRFGDTGSLCAIVRSALESYLTFGYIFYLPKDQSERELRYNTWILSGLIDRRDIMLNWPLSDEHKDKLNVEQIQIDELREILKQNACFKDLSKDKQRLILENGKWRWSKWEDIGVDLKFGREMFRSVYSYLSSQVHTGGLSGIQIRHALLNGDLNPQNGAAEMLIPIVLSKMIALCIEISPHSKLKHEENIKAASIGDIYIGLSKGEFLKA